MSEAPLTCWLCHRPLGRKVQQHHPVPKSKKGRETVPVHPICHKTIHARYTNAQLRRIGDDRAALLEDAVLAGFVEWVKGKPPDFNARVGQSR